MEALSVSQVTVEEVVEDMAEEDTLVVVRRR